MQNPQTPTPLSKAEERAAEVNAAGGKAVVTHTTKIIPTEMREAPPEAKSPTAITEAVPEAPFEPMYSTRYGVAYGEMSGEAFKTIGLTFGEALEVLKRGGRVQRDGWNDKGVFLFLLPAGNPPKSVISDPALRAVVDEHCPGDTFQALPSIRMWTRDSSGRFAVLTGWLASQTDMLSDDWRVVS